MASPATEVDAGGRAVRVSNPDRVIYSATEWTREVTKLDVVNYYLAVGEGILRALDHRPTTLERWPKGVYAGIVRATRDDPHGDAFYQKRVPRAAPPGAPSYKKRGPRGAPPFVETARIEFPSGRSADEVCPTEVAVVAW